MSSARSKLVICLPAIGVTLLVASRLAGDDSPLLAVGPTVSFLFFAAAAILFLLPEPSKQTASEPAKPAPRTLSRDILNDGASTAPLTERIEGAIELSKAMSRSFGILCFRPADPASNTDELLSLAARAIQAQLRKTDRALVGERGEVLVCLPLIAVRSDLDNIATRLDRVYRNAIAERTQRAFDDVPSPDVGVAMYPIAGYSGAELIASAQAACKAARAARVGKGNATAALGGLQPVMPSRKTKRPRRSKDGETLPHAIG